MQINAIVERIFADVCDLALHIDEEHVVSVIFCPRAVGHLAAAGDVELTVAVEDEGHVVAAAALQENDARPVGIERGAGGSAGARRRDLAAALCCGEPAVKRVTKARRRRQPAVGAAGRIRDAASGADAAVGVKVNGRFAHNRRLTPDEIGRAGHIEYGGRVAFRGLRSSSLPQTGSSLYELAVDQVERLIKKKKLLQFLDEFMPAGVFFQMLAVNPSAVIDLIPVVIMVVDVFAEACNNLAFFEGLAFRVFPVPCLIRRVTNRCVRNHLVSARF